MKFVYLTSKTYPSTTADHFFVLEMSRAFSKILREDFLLTVANNTSNELEDIPYFSFYLKIRKGKRLYYFFRLPFFIILKKLYNSDTVFFSNDLNLLNILFFWRKILHFKYRVISDWHMLFSDKKEEKNIEKSDGAITTTKHLKNLMVSRFGVSESKILVAYGGVNLNIFEKITQPTEELKKQLNLPLGDFLVGYVGFYKTMRMSKGLDTMIEALSLIPDAKVKMVFVGGRTDEILEYSKLAEEKGVLSRVLFVPIASPEKIAFYEKAMDVLVIPYPDKPHFREYGFPMKAYEYLASEKPIIFSNLPIIAEVLEDCAIPFIPDNSKDLAEKILESRNNPEKSKTLTKRALEKAKECTWEKRAQNIISFAKDI